MSEIPARPVERQLLHALPPARAEHFQVNTARVEGLIAKVWSYDHHVFARLAVYDRHAEVLPAAESAALPRRKAHYLSLCLPQGRTADGMAVSLQPKERVLVTGYLRDQSYTESLERLFARAGCPERAQAGDERRFINRSATYLMVETLIRLA